MSFLDVDTDDNWSAVDQDVCELKVGRLDSGW